MLRPGGTLVYCVCTPLSREGRDVVNEVVADRQLKRVPISPEEANDFAGGLTPEGDLVTLPNALYGHDVFHISRLERVV